MQTDYQKGLELLKKIHGGHTGEAIVSALGEISPLMADLTIETNFGGIIQQSSLDLKSMEFAILGAVIAQGHMPQLEAHIEGALNVGATKQEIIDLITEIAIYAGFPAAINAMLLAKKVFERHGENNHG